MDLPMLQAVEANGHFKLEGGKYAGMFIKDADPVIIEDLKKSGTALQERAVRAQLSVLLAV